MGRGRPLELTGRDSAVRDHLYQLLKARRESNEGVVVGSPASTEQIRSAEQEIGLLPSDYQAFLATFGWLTLKHHEILGLGNDVPPVLNVVATTLSERREFGLPESLVTIYNDGAGNLTCLDTRTLTPERRTCTVVDVDHELGITNTIADSFDEWLSNLFTRIGIDA